MRNQKLISILIFAGIIVSIFFNLSCKAKDQGIGKTIITKWQYNKNAAVSITFDDGIITHFRVALPLLEENGFPGTFYLITGAVAGSEHKGKFVGREISEIISETSVIPTNESNFFERASSIRFLGYENIHNYYREAADKFRRGQFTEAYNAIDEGYEKVRKKTVSRSDDIAAYMQNVMVIDSDVEMISWDELRTLDATFHEFGSHTVTHPNLAILDENNILYELQKSKEEILNQLGHEHNFTAEAPFGIEDERVINYLEKNYFANRNRMPVSWLTELNRSNKMNPGDQNNEYVQWQRGPLKDTPMEVMKSWIDTIIVHDNIWLTLVFHGVEGVGWEPKSKKELAEYFNYMKKYENSLWVATFADVTKYVKQRMSTEINVEENGSDIIIHLKNRLDKLYDLPLTLKTKVPSSWKFVEISQNGKNLGAMPVKEGRDNFVIYQAYPNDGPVRLFEKLEQ